MLLTSFTSTEVLGSFLQRLLNLVTLCDRPVNSALRRGLLEGKGRQPAQAERNMKCQLTKREAAFSGEVTEGTSVTSFGCAVPQSWSEDRGNAVFFQSSWLVFLKDIELPGHQQTHCVTITPNQCLVIHHILSSLPPKYLSKPSHCLLLATSPQYLLAGLQFPVLLVFQPVSILQPEKWFYNVKVIQRWPGKTFSDFSKSTPLLCVPPRLLWPSQWQCLHLLFRSSSPWSANSGAAGTVSLLL